MNPEGQEALHDLGLCSRIEADSVGSPGQRRFRIRARGVGGTALLWLEKEQLQQLALTIKRLLGTEMVGEGPPGSDGVEEGVSPDYDFEAAQLALGRHQKQGLYVILAYDGPVEQGPATLALWVDRRKMNVLADQAFSVCAAGRSLCALCGVPLNQGETHVCSRANGHISE